MPASDPNHVPVSLAPLAEVAGDTDRFRRDLGLVDLLQDLVPEALAFPVAMLTQLGAIWFAIIVLALVFRYRDREVAMVVAGLFLGGTASWRFIKGIYPVPRPEQEFVPAEAFPFLLQHAYDLAVVQGGPGFPSGHAVTTTVLYFGLGLLLGVGTRRSRFAFAAFMVALVGATRITLGVHFLSDVVVGSLLGHAILLLFLAVVRRTTWDRVDVAFGFAIPIAALNVLANPLDVVILAAALGTYGAWRTWGQASPTPTGVPAAD